MAEVDVPDGDRCGVNLAACAEVVESSFLNFPTSERIGSDEQRKIECASDDGALSSFLKEWRKDRDDDLLSFGDREEEGN